MSQFESTAAECDSATKDQPPQVSQPAQSHFGELTIADAFELKDLLRRRTELASAIPFAGNKVTAPRGRLLRIDQLQSKRQEVRHG